MDRINTYNSKTNYYGNRLNLVLNHKTKQLYTSGGNAFNMGTVENELLQRDIKAIENNYINNENYKKVSHEIAKTWLYNR